MTKTTKIIDSGLIILAFCIAFYGKGFVDNLGGISFDRFEARLVYFYLWWIIPVILTVGFLFGFSNVLKELKLQKGFITGLWLAFLFVLPMLVSSAIIGKINANLSFLELMHRTVVAGFMEEVLFRGFLFGILFRKFNWGFIPASLLGAIFFGLGHLYQGADAMESFTVFLVTFMGALWFAWLFIEWRQNLWLPVFLHIFMNLSWTLFDVGNNAAGDLITNLFRFITIALTVTFTIIKNKRENHFCINRNNLFIKKASASDDAMR